MRQGSSLRRRSTHIDTCCTPCRGPINPVAHRRRIYCAHDIGTSSSNSNPCRSGYPQLVVQRAARAHRAVLLQGVWAGIFLEHDGERDAASSWIDVHARGGDIALALLATIVARWSHSGTAASCGSAALP